MRVGADVEAICGPCGETWHVVVAVVPGRAAQVECKQCGARHRYRPVGAAAAAPPGARRRTAARGKAPQPIVEADPSRPSRAFCVGDRYAVGDRVEHASFGSGVVQMLRGPDKVEILFASGRKVLKHGRDAGRARTTGSS
jgi:hypothetical protein